MSNSVYILGAGFSKAISNSASSNVPLGMPLTSELSAGLLSSLDIPEDISGALAKLGNNFEQWLTYLSQDNPARLSWDNQRCHAVFSELTHELGKLIHSREESTISSPVPVWLESFVKHLHESKSPVISLNYDTLIERAAASTLHSYMPSDSYVVPVILGHARLASLWGRDEVPTFQLVKLHGSVNWYHSDTSSSDQIYYVRTFWSQKNEQSQHDFESLRDKIRLLLPPSLDKSIGINHVAFRYQWQKAAEFIRKAEKIICMGYSLPESDLLMHFLIRTSPNDTRRRRLLVVDTDVSVVKRYQRILGSSYKVSLHECDGPPIPHYCSELQNH